MDEKNESVVGDKEREACCGKACTKDRLSQKSCGSGCMGHSGS